MASNYSRKSASSGSRRQPARTRGASGRGRTARPAPGARPQSRSGPQAAPTVPCPAANCRTVARPGPASSDVGARGRSRSRREGRPSSAHIPPPPHPHRNRCGLRGCASGGRDRAVLFRRLLHRTRLGAGGRAPDRKRDGAASRRARRTTLLRVDRMPYDRVCLWMPGYRTCR